MITHESLKHTALQHVTLRGIHLDGKAQVIPLCVVAQGTAPDANAFLLTVPYDDRVWDVTVPFVFTRALVMQSDGWHLYVAGRFALSGMGSARRAHFVPTPVLDEDPPTVRRR